MENEIPFILQTKLQLTQEASSLFEEAYFLAEEREHEFITPEHVLYILTNNPLFMQAIAFTEGDGRLMAEKVKAYLGSLEVSRGELKSEPTPSIQFLNMVKYAEAIASSSGKSSLEVPHIIRGLIELQDSMASYLLLSTIKGEGARFMSNYLSFQSYGEEDFGEEDFEDWDIDEERIRDSKEKTSDWRSYVVCLNEIYKEHNPLIGREEELEKTMRVLCRKDKNNPLHIGEPGVGKTALVYGLAAEIEEGKVPERLKGSKIYQIDIGNLLAGTQFRGDFEKRIKMIMEGLSKEEKAIVYFDEIHNLIGAGATGESSMDASNMLKPYLEGGKIRFIGATTYDEYKRHFAKSKGIVRRFSNIDVPEPTIEEATHIIRQLQPLYEEYHKVKYNEDAIEYAVTGSARHINDRFLPDKAIDLIDESGAMKQMEKSPEEEKVVDKELISKVLAKICKVESLAITEEDPQNLENLESRISAQLFGQETAVREVSESVLMSKAGLTDASKPMASLLFVGPTGVGKTELAKLLSQELGVELIRFDMSEYTEKHTVAKLIGSPAGYVGYEDGGLLTDAIRKSPNAVLLLDEIEKAHQDIYNILLQVMDYARLTDNKGNKADFRNVILIMTSNAGAQFASQASVGFGSRVTQGDAMLKQVKKTFKPEFLNRLSALVVFNDMNRDMASLILNKKLKELENALEPKNVKLEITKEAKEFLLDKGFTAEYGARELDRVIHHELKRLLMKEILFGVLKEGGTVHVVKTEAGLKIEKNGN